MNLRFAAFALVSTLASAPAMAATPVTTVYNTDLPVVSGPTAETTTDATGTRTTSTGARVSAPYAPNRWHQTDVGGGATVGITTDYADATGGNGSAYFKSTSASSKADLTYYNGSLTPLSSFSDVSYQYFRDSSSTTDANFAPALRFIMYKGNETSLSYAGVMVLESFYQNQSAPLVDSWQLVSSTQTSGIWWVTSAALGTTFAAGDGKKTLQGWIDANAGSTLYVAGYNFGVGSGWGNSFEGALDNISIRSDLGAQDFNFEVAATGAVPEPATWAMMIGGIGLAGGAMRRRRQANTTVRFA